MTSSRFRLLKTVSVNELIELGTVRMVHQKRGAVRTLPGFLNYRSRYIAPYLTLPGS
jgi:hypothetical protein